MPQGPVPVPVPVLDIHVWGRVWLLAPDGSATLADGARTAHGMGAPWPEPFSAAYVSGGTLWLRVGPRRWDVSAIERVRQLREDAGSAVYALDLAGGRSEEVVVTFPDDVRRARLDPTHDETESQTEDVLRLLPYEAADGWRSQPGTVAEWAARVTPRWTAGLPA